MRARRWGIGLVAATLLLAVFAIVGSAYKAQLAEQETENAVRQEKARAAQREKDQEFGAARAQVVRLSGTAAREQSDFRLAILLSLASMAEAARINEDTQPLAQSLKEKLLRAPRHGGIFAAATLNPEAGMFAWLDTSQQYIGVCSLKTTKNCNDGSVSASLSSGHAKVEVPNFFYPLSARVRLRQGNPAIGFIDGIKDPVIYRHGMIYYRRNNEWQPPQDLAALVPDIDEQTGFVLADIVKTGIKITVNNWPANSIKFIHLSVDPSADRPFTRDGQWREPWWRPGSPAPIISANGKFSAFVYAPEPEKSGNPDAQARRFLTVQPLTTTAVEPTTEESIEIDEASVQESVRWLLRRPGVGFSEDSRFFAVQYKNKIRLFDLRKSTTAHEELTLRSHSDESVSGPAFAQPPLALVNRASRSNDTLSLRFAWSTRHGMHVVDRAADSSLLEPDKSLLAGPYSAIRLVFSDDGAFLMLQAVQQNAFNRIFVRIWDLSQDWKDEISALLTNDKLRPFACRVAAVGSIWSEENRRERRGDKFTEEEMQDRGITEQPCP